MRDRLIDTARSYLGIREVYYKGQPINRSPILDLWFRDFGLKVPKEWWKPGYYWCMVYVVEMQEKVHKSIGKKNPYIKTASVSMQLRNASRIGSGLEVIRMNGIGVKVQKADVFYIKEGKDYDNDIGKIWSGHTGFIDSVLNSRTVLTDEGNTNKYGSRNGDRSSQKKRDKLTFIAITRERNAK